MAENPVLTVWRQALATGDVAAAEQAIIEQARADRITSDNVETVANLLRESPPATELRGIPTGPHSEVAANPPHASVERGEERLLLTRVLFRATQHHPSIDQRLRFLVSTSLWEALPDWRRDLLHLKVDAVRAALASAPRNADEALTASLLGDLGACLAQLGEPREALPHLEAALRIRRGLAQPKSIVVSPDAAMMAAMLGDLLQQLGDLSDVSGAQDPLNGLRESQGALVRMARQDSSALAITLVFLGNVLGQLGERGRARQAYEEALAMYRDLVQADPGAFEPAMATALGNLAAVLSQLGERSAARQTYEETLAIQRRLPAAHEADMAMTLNNLGVVLFDLGEQTLARQAYEEALSIQRRWPAIQADMAMTLSNLGGVLASLGEPGSARRVLEEGLAIQRGLAESEPAAFAPSVAATLSNLGGVLLNLGEKVLARQALEEARELAQRGEMPLRARIAAGLGLLLYDTGEQKRGLELAREAVDMLEGWLSVPQKTDERFSFKGEMEGAYALLLCEPSLAQEPSRACRLIEAQREGELLATLGVPPGGRVAEAPVEAKGMAFLSIQQTRDGMAFLLGSAGEVRFEGGDASWVDAAKGLLHTVLAAEEAGRDCTASIAAAGKEVWDATPAWVRDVLSSPPPGGVALSLDPGVGVVPLELLTPTGAPDDFLCLRMEMPRVPGERLFGQCLARGTIDGAAGSSAFVVGNPVHRRTQLLMDAEREAAALASHLSAVGFAPALPGGMPCLGGAAGCRTFLEGVMADPAIIHYAGHGAAMGEDECLLLAGDDALTADALLKQSKPLTHSPLVFLNSCLTGRARAYGGAFRGLPVAFLRLGAAAVVASIFPIADARAAEFAIAFYQKILTGATVGEAMLRTRQEMRDAGVNCLHWARPVLYGNPHARLKLPTAP